MYPSIHIDLDNNEFNSEVSEKNVKNENECDQFIPKTKKLTKEFCEKMRISKLAKMDTYILDDGWNTNTLILVIVFAFLFLSSFSTFIFMWYTDGFNNIVYSHLVLKEDSPTYEMWSKPTPKLLANFYLFNYTNVDKYIDGTDEKLHVEEKGPYVYEETLERVNAKFNGSYVSYQHKRSYRFVPELSKGRQNDIFMVPNLITMSAAAMHRYSNFFTRMAIAGGLNSLNMKPFHKLAADRVIIGYDDELYSLSRSVLKFRNVDIPDKLGILGQKNGLSPDIYTINIGEDNIEEIGKVKSINGNEQFDTWSTKECNSMDGTDGTFFSPKAVSQKKPLRILVKEMCTTMELVYKQDDSIFDGDIPSYRYVIPEDIFDTPDKTPKNQCFCEMEGGTCPPQGIYNTTLCSMGVPMMVSFPHFYRGDPILYESIIGLNPNGTLHDSYADLHPKWGFPMNAKLRMQLNIQVSKTSEFSEFSNFQDGLILPMAWLEATLEDKTLPEEVKELINMATHTVSLIERLLKYGSIILAILTVVPIIANIRHRLNKSRRKPGSKADF